MADDFTLSPPPLPGEVPQSVIAELRECRKRAADFSQAFSEACKMQAEKYGVAPSALRRFVCALEGDSIDKLTKEAEDIERLVGAE